MTILSILEKDKSSSLLIAGSKTVPSLSSLTCSLKNVVCGGSNASINLAANVTTALAPTLCHGVWNDLRFIFVEVSSCIKYGNVSSEHSTALFKN